MKNFSQDTKVAEVKNYKNFDDFGRLIFPVDLKISGDMPLKNLSENFIWYSCVNPKKTVEIVNSI